MDYEEPDIVSNEFMPSAVGDYDSLAWSLCISLPFILTKLGKAMTVFTPAVISMQIASGFFVWLGFLGVGFFFALCLYSAFHNSVLHWQELAGTPESWQTKPVTVMLNIELILIW